MGPQPLMLSFNRAETGALFTGVLLATVVCGDGRSNWSKGVQLATVPHQRRGTSQPPGQIRVNPSESDQKINLRYDFSLMERW